MTDKLTIGSHIRCKIISLDKKKKRVDLSHKALNSTDTTTMTTTTKSSSKIEIGNIVTGKVLQVRKENVLIGLGNSTAVAYFTDLSDNYMKYPKKSFEPGQYVQGKIIDIRPRETIISLRSSLVNPNQKVKKEKNYQKFIKNGDEVTVGDRVLGYITEFKLSPTYFLVRIASNTFVKVIIRNLDDYYVPEDLVRKRVKPGKLVAVRITQIEYVYVICIETDNV